MSNRLGEERFRGGGIFFRGRNANGETHRGRNANGETHRLREKI